MESVWRMAGVYVTMDGRGKTVQFNPVLSTMLSHAIVMVIYTY